MHARDERDLATAHPATPPRRDPRVDGPADVYTLIGLQRTAGNRAVQTMLAGQTVQRVEGDWPSADWAAELGELRTGNHLLGPGNRAFRGALNGRPAMEGLADQFVASLLDNARSADDAKALLLAMRDLMLNARARDFPTGPGALSPSLFPTLIYNELTEIINAKRLWQAGDHTLRPWPFNAGALKPDYFLGDAPPQTAGTNAASFYDQTAAIGDHVKVTGRSDLAQVLDGFATNVSGKLAAYPDKQVRVIVDVSDNRASELHAQSADVLRTEFARMMGTVGDVSRLIQVDVILPNATVIAYQRPPAADTSGPATSGEASGVSRRWRCTPVRRGPIWKRATRPPHRRSGPACSARTRHPPVPASSTHCVAGGARCGRPC